MQPDVKTLNDQGAQHYAADRFADALECYEAALARDPSEAMSHYNAGNALYALGRTRAALSAYSAAVDLQPNFAIAHHNRAASLLRLGDLAAGFREYEWRKACPQFSADARYRLPRPWRGEDLAGKTLYVFPELYQGDLLQFARYARMAEQIGARVILAAPPNLHAILRTMSETLEFVPREAPAPEYDFQSALFTLPAIFGTTLETVPAAPAYIFAEPARVAKWGARIGTGGFKIGIAWQGSPIAVRRSFPLAVAAAALAGLPDVRLISLQKHAGLEQLAALPPGTVEDLGPEFDAGPDAFLDTAAAMTACDLFITADTSVVHVGGALGVPTWLANPSPGDWRWLEGTEHSPWYPSVRVFRQPATGDWPGVFAIIAEAVRGLADGRAPA